MSLRLRLTLFMALVATVAVASISWLSYTSTVDEALGNFDEFLLERSGTQSRFSNRGFSLEELPSNLDLIPLEDLPLGMARFDVAIQLIDADGTVTQLIGAVPLPFDQALIDTALSGEAVIEEVMVEGVHYRMITSPGSDGRVVQIARDMTETDALLGSLRVRLWIVGSAGVLLAAVAAWFVSKRALTPVGRLTQAAEHVAETGRLDALLPGARDDEVGRLAGAFNRMLAALSKSREQQRRLVDDAGHELRTPLTSLRTNLEVLQRNADMDRTQRMEIIDDAAFEVEQLSELVSEVIELTARPDTPKPPMVESHLDEIVGEAVLRAQKRTSRSIEVLGPGGQAMVRRGRIARAVANLIDNADKWNPPAGRITVKVTGGMIEVLDEGPGIPNEELDRVFDRFYRTDAARTTPGSGLGLAIVKQVAEEHGGTAWARNRREGGAAVGFEIPVVEVSDG